MALLFQRLSCCTRTVNISCSLYTNNIRTINNKFLMDSKNLKMFQRQMLFSTSKCRFEEEKKITDQEEYRLVYEGPLSKKIKYLKMFSMSTACISLAAPGIFFLSSSSLAPVAKIILASTVVMMGVTTTSLLHWLTRVYVHRMFFHPQSRTFAAETSTIFGTMKKHKFSVEDIIIPKVESGFSTFEAKGNKYFIHMELKEADQILRYVREYNLESL